MKERYIKIDDCYYPIDGMIWHIDAANKRVSIAEVGGTDSEFGVVAIGEDATNLIALLDGMSFDLSLAREDRNG